MNSINDGSGINYEKRKIQFQNSVEFLIAPLLYDDKITDNITPKVSNLHVLTLSGIALTITNFYGGSDNQMLRILGDGVCVIKNNTKIKTNIGADKTLMLNKVYTFHYINDIWYESV